MTMSSSLLKCYSCCFSIERACEGQEALRWPLPLLQDPRDREPVREEAHQEVPGGQVGDTTKDELSTT